MNFISLCSGIEAASVAFKPLGWKALAFSEIEKFPCAVLKHHYPDVPNLGDMTRITENETFKKSRVDLICGGTPCQSFSIAGKRAGLDDPRGNLALHFLKVVDVARPRWFIWENVPGLFSDKGGALKQILDEIENIGYVIDIDILNAEFHGVPQKRRRIFICGQSVETLVNQRTVSSCLTIAQCLVEILHGICAEQLNKYENEPAKSGPVYLSKDGAIRRMKLFKICEKVNFKELQQNLIEVFQRFPLDAGCSELRSGASEKERIADDLLTDFVMETQSLLTEESLRIGLEEGYKIMKSYTTSISKSLITPKEIYSCSQTVLLIGKLICHLRRLSPSSSSAGLSFLMAVKEFTNYARKNDSELFGGMDGVYSWGDFIRQTKYIFEVVGYLGNWTYPAAVLFERESLQGNFDTSKKKGEEIAGTIGGGSGNRGWCNDLDGSGAFIPSTFKMEAFGKYSASASAIKSRDYKDATDLIVYENHGQDSRIKEVSTLPQLNAQAGTGGNNLPLVMAFNENQQGAVWESDTIQALNKGGGKPGQGYPAVHVRAFKQRPEGDIIQSDKAYNISTTSNATAGNTAKIQQGASVRRLTPLECERAQGFPDNYTQIPYKDKPPDKCPDGPRYKAIGNSWAVPCARWIGERIQKVDNI